LLLWNNNNGISFFLKSPIHSPFSWSFSAPYPCHFRRVSGSVQGSPDNPQMVPVSFGAYGFTGSHGGFWRLVNPGSRIEPGDRATDQTARKKAAIAKTKAELIQRLNEWLKPCNCVYERMQ